MGAPNGREEDRLCELCGRALERMTRHHLIPRSRHRKILGSKKRRRQFDREYPGRTTPLRGPFHGKVNQTFTEAELERDYPTVEALASDSEIGALWTGAPANFRAPSGHLTSGELGDRAFRRSRGDFSVSRVPYRAGYPGPTRASGKPRPGPGRSGRRRSRARGTVPPRDRISSR